MKKRLAWGSRYQILALCTSNWVISSREARVHFYSVSLLSLHLLMVSTSVLNIWLKNMTLTCQQLFIQNLSLSDDTQRGMLTAALKRRVHSVSNSRISSTTTSTEVKTTDNDNTGQDFFSSISAARKHRVESNSDDLSSEMETGKISEWQFVWLELAERLSTHQGVICTVEYRPTCQCCSGAFVLFRRESFLTTAH